MSFAVPSFEQIRDRYLQAIVNLSAGAAIGPDSDNFVRASAVAAVMEGLYSHDLWVFRQAFADLADADYMENMANRRGIMRRAAVAATGSLVFSGAVGAAVPVNTLVEFPASASPSGVSQTYATSAAAVVGAGGTVSVAAIAVVPGVAGNMPGPAVGTVINPPVDITGVSIQTMAGGLEAETNAALLERLLFDLRNPTAGGNAADYERWAKQVAGVARAYVYPLRRGDGTVDVVPLPASGLPSLELLAAVQSYIDNLRPVGLPVGGFTALAPTAVVVPVTATVTLQAGFLLADVVTSVTTALQAYFWTMAPGDTVVRTRLMALISNTQGVADVLMSAPAANVATVVNSGSVQLAQLGTVTLTT